MADLTIEKIPCFDPAKIAMSGQAFRFNVIDDFHTELVAYGRYLQIAKLDEDRFAFSCTGSDFEKIWRSYFHLDYDYASLLASIPSEDRYLKAASYFSYGIRILRQEHFETLISFIISQRRSIPSIMTSVERLCSFTGREALMPDLSGDIFVKPVKGKYYAFPTSREMSSMSLTDIASLGVGYRADYIESAVRNNPDLDSWDNLSDEDLYSELLSLRGVGKKVADCVMLFSYARHGRFPVDVWMQRIQDKYYGGSFDTTDYPDTAGIIQQFMFFYERNRNI